LADALEPLRPLRLAETTGPGHATELAREAAAQGVERILVVGGDGTLHEVVNGLDLPASCTIGLLPAGTGNDLARSLGIPLDVEDAIEVVRAGEAHATDVMTVDVDGLAEVAVNAACGGFGGEVNARLTQELKDRWGPMAYVKASLDALREIPVHQLRLRFDDRDVAELPVHSLVIANGAYAAHGVCVAPGARPDDGVLAVHAVLPRPLKDLLAVAPAVLRGEVPDADHYRVWTCEVVTVEARETLEVSVDGELRSGRRFRYEARPGALRIFRPKVLEGADTGGARTRTPVSAGA
jgi:diacylglycerol kinase (ATP)